LAHSILKASKGKPRFSNETPAFQYGRIDNKIDGFHDDF